MKFKKYLFKTSILTVVLGLTLTGCTTNLVTQKRVIAIKLDDTKIKNNELQALSIPADLRLLYYWKDTTGKLIACTQPVSDVAKSDSFGSSGNTGVKLSDSTGVLKNDISAEGKINSSTTVLQLNGRSSAVLLARDLLFNTCAFAANGWIDATQIKEGYSAALKVAENVSKAETEATETNSLIIKNSLGLDPKVLDESAKTRIAYDFLTLFKDLNKCNEEAKEEDAKKRACLQKYNTSAITRLNEK